MRSILSDVRYSIRGLIKTPLFALTAIVTVALGIGANTAIFSVINSLLLQPTGFGDIRQIVELNGFRYAAVAGDGLSPMDSILRLKDSITSFEYFAAYTDSPEGANLTGELEPERVAICDVSPNFFELLKVTPLLGRTFVQNESDQVVVLSYGLWRRHFSSDPKVVGGPIELDGRTYTVIGITPEDFQYPHGIDVWAPMSQATHFINSIFLAAFVGKLKPGVSILTAQAEMNSLKESPIPAIPVESLKSTLVPLKTTITGGVKPDLMMLSGAVLLVLLIACINVANLLLARATTRVKEVAIRYALGATRRRLIRQMMVEATVIAAVAAITGFLLALWGVDVLKSISPHSISKINDIHIDGTVLLFTAVVSALSVILFAVVPAIRGSKVDLNETLKQAAQRSRQGPGSHSLSRLLVGVEVAMSVVLLSGAGLLVRSLIQLQRVDPGYDAAGVTTMALALPEPKYPTAESKQRFYEQVIQRIRTLPGVQCAGGAANIPLGPTSGVGFQITIDGKGTPDNEFAVYNVASPGYFPAMGVHLLSGRDFTDQDTKNSQGVVIISRSMANRFWPDADAIGKHVKLFQDNAFRVVVGVVGDVKGVGLESDSLPMETYVPPAQGDLPLATLAVRSNLPAKALMGGIATELHALDPDLPLYDVKTMTERLAISTSDRRFYVLLLGVFAAIAVILAAIGLYGVISYVLAQRTQEIGIRMAVGAGRSDILRLAITQGMIPALIGILAGLAGALALSRLIAGFLFGITSHDAPTFVVVSALLLLIALASCIIPAARATRIDPLEALRYE
ncbi:MAG TPA: ABC transporter permease [Blastocatellia bacterium]